MTIEFSQGWETKVDARIYKSEIEPHLTAAEHIFLVAGYDLYVFDPADGTLTSQLDPEHNPTITSPIAVDTHTVYLPISWGIPDDGGMVWPARLGFRDRTIRVGSRH